MASERIPCPGLTKKREPCTRFIKPGEGGCFQHRPKGSGAAPADDVEPLEKMNALSLDGPVKFFAREDGYFEFSNYYASTFTIEEILFRSVEQFYQAYKFYNPDDPISMEYFQLLLEADSPQKVKDMGNQRVSRFGAKWLINKAKPALGTVKEAVERYSSLEMRPDWDEIKVEVMEEGLMAKFTQNPRLRELLLSTGDRELIEDSPRDNFWGNARNGQNMLGKLLMKIRTELRVEQ